jgi:ATP-dependent RNA helicase HelY
VVDLLDQVRVASGADPLGRVAADAVRAVRRGVVALGTA